VILIEVLVARRTNLAVKMDVLRRLEAGESAVNIGKALNLPATTVRTIRVSADKIKISVRSSSSLSAAKTSRTRSGVMLAIWIEDQNQRNAPASLM
jgi:hypothetical protein